MNNKVIAYAALIAYIAAACTSPVWVAIWTVAFFIAIPFFTEVVNTLLPVDGQPMYQSPAPSMSDYYEAFSVEPEVEQEQEPDVWGEDTTACELACTVTIEPVYQLALPAANVTVETVTVVAYSDFTYRELQAMVKSVRPNAKAIKLNSKRAVLEAYLLANA